jgi:hypothetical protein
MNKGAYSSVIEAAIAAHSGLAVSSMQIEARVAIASPATVQSMRAFTRVFVRGANFEDIPRLWPKVAPLFEANPTGIVFKAKAPLNTDALANVIKVMRGRGVEAPLLIELPPGACSADDARACVETLGVSPNDLGFCLNASIMHSSGIRVRTAPEVHAALRGWPIEFLKLIYLNGAHGRGGTAIPHAEDDAIWGGSPRAGVPDLPWAEPPTHAQQKMIDIRDSGAGLMMKYARHHDIPVILETRATHNPEDIAAFVRLCGRA